MTNLSTMFPRAAVLLVLAGCSGTMGGTGVDADAGSSADGGSDASDAAIATAEGGTDAPSAPTVDPTTLLAHCTGARDVFYVDVTGDGPFRRGEHIATNLDATWRVSTTPMLSIAVDKVGGGGRFGIWTPKGGVPPVGVYQHTPQSGFSAPSLNLAIGSQGCGVKSGSFALVTATQEPGLTELTAWFDITCQWDPPVAVRGCIRWEHSS